MFSSKTLFLGVYSANGIIRLLFLPLCYLFLFSPFALLASRYYRLDQQILGYIPADYKTPDVWPQLFIAVIAVLLATRIISGTASRPGKHDGKRRVQLLPFWIPGFRHWGNLVFGGEMWLRGVRDTSIANVVAYSPSGAKHNVILSAPLLDLILGATASLEESELNKWALMRNAFGLPQSGKSQYLMIRPSVTGSFETQIFKGKQLKDLTSAFLRSLSEALPDFVTFNSSLVDQLQWERVANIELTDGTEEVECDLFALINDFFCHAIVPLIAGPQFPESYELLATDLAVFNQSFYALSLGLPRFFPLPGLPGASLARKRLLQNFSRLFKELTNPPQKREIPDDESVSGEETDADTPTPLTALNDIFTQHDLPMQARAAIALEVVHRITSKAVPLAFWTILHIYQHSSPSKSTSKPQPGEGAPTPLQAIRAETSTWAQAIQPPSIHPSFPAPPEISFSSTSHCFNPSSLPYLRACIFESRRLYNASITTAKITKPIIVTDPSTTGTREEQWQLDANTYLDIGLSQRLINTSPAEFVSPSQWNPTRSTFSHSQSPAPLSATTFDDSEELVTAMLVPFIAGVCQLWEIEAAPKRGMWEEVMEAQKEARGEGGGKKERKEGVWVVPRAVDGGSVLIPKGDVRVRVRRREGLVEKRRAV